MFGAVSLSGEAREGPIKAGTMRAEIARLAEAGRPDVGSDGAVTWPSEQFIAGGQGAHQYVVTTDVTNALALTVWLNKDALTAQLDGEIERLGDDTTALSREAQAARIAECETKLLELQRRAEAITEYLIGKVSRCGGIASIRSSCSVSRNDLSRALVVPLARRSAPCSFIRWRGGAAAFIMDRSPRQHRPHSFEVSSSEPKRARRGGERARRRADLFNRGLAICR